MWHAFFFLRWRRKISWAWRVIDPSRFEVGPHQTKMLLTLFDNNTTLVRPSRLLCPLFSCFLDYPPPREVTYESFFFFLLKMKQQILKSARTWRIWFLINKSFFQDILHIAFIITGSNKKRKIGWNDRLWVERDHCLRHWCNVKWWRSRTSNNLIWFGETFFLFLGKVKKDIEQMKPLFMDKYIRYTFKKWCLNKWNPFSFALDCF